MSSFQIQENNLLMVQSDDSSGSCDHGQVLAPADIEVIKNITDFKVSKKEKKN